MKTSRGIFFIAAGILSALLWSCKSSPKQQENKDPDLVVYCENGILGPIKDISNSFEKKTGLKIKIQNDCSRNLTSLIHYQREADIFIPDARQTIDNIMMVSPDIASDSVFLGYQTLVYLVAKKNPTQFKGDFHSLPDPSNGLIFANPESSTLGLATSLLLEKHSMYKQAMNSVLLLTTDSKALTRKIATGQATVAITWKSDYIFNRHHMKVDTISIPSPFKYYPAIAIMLKDAPNEDNAKRYLKNLKSKANKKILKKYGIDDFKLSHF